MLSDKLKEVSGQSKNLLWWKVGLFGSTKLLTSFTLEYCDFLPCSIMFVVFGFPVGKLSGAIFLSKVVIYAISKKAVLLFSRLG